MGYGKITTKKISIFVSILLIFYMIVYLLSVCLYYPIILINCIVGFILFTLAPGMLILNMLNVRELPYYEYFGLSLGLSLSYDMFIGLAINFIYPIFGISRPMSSHIVNITLLFFLVILCFIAYLLVEDDVKFRLNSSFFKYVTMFCVPLLIVINSYIFKFHIFNYIRIALSLSLFLIFALSTLVIFLDNVDSIYYPFILFVISASLSLYGALYYPNLFFDTGWEYFLAKHVVISGVWLPYFPSVRNNSMLYSVILHPMMSFFCHISLYYTYKLLNPIICSFVVFIIYAVFIRQTNNEYISFISSLLILYMFTFYTWFASNTRQGGGFLYLALIIYLLFDRVLPVITRKIFLIIFTVSLVLSHYGTTYFYIYLLLGYLIIFTIRCIKSGWCNSEISSGYVFFLLVLTFWYYLYTSGSAPLFAIYKFFINTIGIVGKGIFTKKSVLVRSYGYHWPLSIRLSRDILLVTFIIIFVDIAYEFIIEYKSSKSNFNKIFSFSILVLFLYCITLINPDFGRGRVIVLGYLFLAPFFYRGFKRIFKYIFKTKFNLKLFKFAIFLYLLIYYIFPIGIVSITITDRHDYSPIVYINKDYAFNIKNYNEIKDPYFLRAFYRIYARYDEISSGKWLSRYWNTYSEIYVEKSGYVGELTLVPYVYLNKFGKSPFNLVIFRNVKFIPNSYIYLRYFNYVIGVTFKTIPTKCYPINMSEFSTINKIYDNGGSSILYS